MANIRDPRDGKNFNLDVRQACPQSPLKESNSLDRAVKNRLARIFSPDDCRTGHGTNIFPCEAPKAMIQAVRVIVHGDETPEKALELYHSVKSMETKGEYAE